MDQLNTDVSWRKRPKLGTVHDLLAMAHDRSRAGREHLATAVSDLFAEKDTVLTERERSIMTDILTRLVKDVETSVRRKLAQRLADIDVVPRELIVALANDEIEIAAPVLSRSKVLQDVDLIEVIRHRTLEHQLAIAMRETVAASVSSALVEAGDGSVVEALLCNQGATIGPDTMTLVVDQSRDRRNYQEPLLRREELSPDLAKRMYSWVSEALRAMILERYELDAHDLDAAMAGAVRDSFEEAESDEREDDSDPLAALLALDEVAQSELVKTLREGEITKFQLHLQKATGLRLPFLRILMFEPGGERLAIVCRAIDMAPKVFSAIFRLLRASSQREARMRRGEMTRIAALYLDIKTDLAMTVLRQWRRNPDFFAEIEQVTGETLPD